MKKTILLLSLLAIGWTGFGSWYWTCKVKNNCNAFNAEAPIKEIKTAEISTFDKKLLSNGSNIYFDSGKSELREDGFKTLNHIIENMNENDHVVINLKGHADITGNSKFNETLSKERAETVRKYLNYKGIQDCRFYVESFGDKIPNATNKTAEGRQLNRRVEIRFQN